MTLIRAKLFPGNHLTETSHHMEDREPPPADTAQSSQSIENTLILYDFLTLRQPSNLHRREMGLHRKVFVFFTLLFGRTQHRILYTVSPPLSLINNFLNQRFKSLFFAMFWEHFPVASFFTGDGADQRC